MLKHSINDCSVTSDRVRVMLKLSQKIKSILASLLVSEDIYFFLAIHMIMKMKRKMKAPAFS